MHDLGVNLFIDDSWSNVLAATQADPPIPTIVFGHQVRLPEDWPGLEMTYEERVKAGIEYPGGEVDVPNCVRARDWEEVEGAIEQFKTCGFLRWAFYRSVGMVWVVELALVDSAVIPKVKDGNIDDAERYEAKTLNVVDEVALGKF